MKFDVVTGAQDDTNEAYTEYVQEMGSRSSNTLERQNPKPITVLIDDDRLVSLNWTNHFKKNDFLFFGFKSMHEFLAASSSFDNASRIYIDSNLGDGIKGEVESEKIFALGSLNLYLATGYEKDSIQKPAWIREVFSKSQGNIS